MNSARKPPIPILVVAGPRGAGKTRLINRLLADPAFADTAVILNDFGATELAGGIAERAEDGLIALASGCVCCAVRGALTDSLEKLLRDIDNRRVARIARIIIEADETADPATVIAAVERHPYLSLRYVAGGVVVALAAAQAPAALAERADTVRQVAAADAIVVGGGLDASLAAALRALNPVADVVEAARIEPSHFAAYDDEPAVDLMTLVMPESPAQPVGEAARVHVFLVRRPGMMPFAALDRFVEYLAMLASARLLRVRAVVSTGPGEATIVDGAGGTFRPPQIVDHAGEPSLAFLITGLDFDRSTFERYLEAFLGQVQVDTPDQDALTANPLAIAGFSARSGR